MKIFFVLLLSCSSLFAGERFVSLGSGETNYVSYGVSCLISDSRSVSNLAAPPGSELFLTLRNDGAKFMSFRNITTTNFSLRDANGRVMDIYVRSSAEDVRSIPYGVPTVIQLGVNTRAAPEPWTLRFHSQRGPYDHPFDLTITGIKPPSSPRK